MSLSKAEIENLSQLLISTDESNIEIAFEILKGIKDDAVLSDLVTEFFALYKIGKEAHNSSVIYRTINWDHFSKIESFLNRILETYTFKIKKKFFENIGIKIMKFKIRLPQHFAYAKNRKMGRLILSAYFL